MPLEARRTHAYVDIKCSISLNSVVQKMEKKGERVERAGGWWPLWSMVGFWDHASRRGLQPALPCLSHRLRHWDALLSKQTLPASLCSLQRGLSTYRAKGHTFYTSWYVPGVLAYA